MPLMTTVVEDYAMREVMKPSGLLSTIAGGFGARKNGKIYVVKLGFQEAQTQNSTEKKDTVFLSPEDLTLEIDSKNEVFQGMELSRRQEQAVDYNLSKEYGEGLGQSIRGGLEQVSAREIFSGDSISEVTSNIDFTTLARADELANKARFLPQRYCLVSATGLRRIREMKDGAGHLIFSPQTDQSLLKLGISGSFWNYQVVLSPWKLPCLHDSQDGIILYDRLVGAWGAEKNIFLNGPTFHNITRSYRYLGSQFYGTSQNTIMHPEKDERVARFICIHTGRSESSPKPKNSKK